MVTHQRAQEYEELGLKQGPGGASCTLSTAEGGGDAAWPWS